MITKLKVGIRLDKVLETLMKLRKSGIFIIQAGEHDAKLFDDSDGTLKIESMSCTLFFYDIDGAENGKEKSDTEN